MKVPVDLQPCVGKKRSCAHLCRQAAREEKAIGDAESKADGRWSESIGVGSSPFVNRVKIEVGSLAKCRTIRDRRYGLELWEKTAAHDAALGIIDRNIAPKKNEPNMD